jgi:hypothetical protein
MIDFYTRHLDLSVPLVDLTLVYMQALVWRG